MGSTSTLARDLALLPWVGALLGIIEPAREIHAQGYLGAGLFHQAAAPLPAALGRGMLLGAIVTLVGIGLFRLASRLAGHRRALALYLFLCALAGGGGLAVGLGGRLGLSHAEAAGVMLLLLVGGAWYCRSVSISALKVAAIPILLLGGAIAGEAWLEARVKARAAGRPSILFVLVDALRADHVSCYGYDRPTTPTLDRLAERGARFSRCVSPSSRTRTTMPSIWTGLYPSRHGVFGRRDVLAKRFTTAAEILREHGYATAALCPNPSLNRLFGHAQGWDIYEDDLLDRSGPPGAPRWQTYETAARLNERLLRWLDGGDREPFLAWIHYRDVHGPYLPPPPYDTLFPAGTGRPLSAQERESLGEHLRLENDGGELGFYLSQYDGEIRYTDDRIGELLASLAQRGLMENTVVIVTSDHGEAFLEHGAWDHGDTVYEEMVHVPLVIVTPGGKAEVVERVVSTVDLFATILDLARVSPSASDGFSLVPLLRGRADAYHRLQALAETDPRMSGQIQRALREGEWKLIVDNGKGRASLFNLARDPGETADVLESEPAIARRLWADLERFVDGAGGRLNAPASRARIDAELEDRLKSLGYVE